MPAKTDRQNMADNIVIVITTAPLLRSELRSIRIRAGQSRPCRQLWVQQYARAFSISSAWLRGLGNG
jgi:hypothetical protein